MHIDSYCHIWPQGLSKNATARLEAQGYSVSEKLVSLYRALDLQYGKFHKMDNLSKLGFLGAESLLAGNEELKDTSVVLCNRSSSLESDRLFESTLNDIPSPAQFVYTLPNIAVGEICIRHKIQGENSFLLTNEFDASILIQAIEQTFIFGGAKQCLGGWIECINNDFYCFLFLAKDGEGIVELTESALDALYLRKQSWKN